MDESLTIDFFIMLLIGIQMVYMSDILNNIDRNSSIMIDQMERILTIVDNLDNRSEQADDRSQYFNERRRSIDNAIVNP
jgi:hypothetical protein